MSNVLSEEVKEQIIALGRLGWSLRRIQQETGVRRETASGYLRTAGIEVRGRGRPRQQVRGAKPAISVTTDSEPVKAAISELPTPSPDAAAGASASISEPFREAIELGLRQGRNAMGIWQDLVSQDGFRGGYQSVKRFVRKLRGSQTPEACAVIVTPPGEEAQVDYGARGPLVRDPDTGKYRRTRLFVLTLGYSRKAVRLLTFRSSARIWAELHEKAFRRLGGCPRAVVLDNLREGVLKPDIYDPTLNPLYRDVLAHYGIVALPCRVNHPDRKGKVESAVGHTQRTPLKGKRYESLEDGQTYLDDWDTHWADTRIHGTTKRQVAAMFAEEKPHLLPLPLEPFRYYQFGQRKVHPDGCVEVAAAYYSAPPGWIGRSLKVQWDSTFVRILHPETSFLMREHVRQRRGLHRIQAQDRSPRTPAPVRKLLWRCQQAGSHIGIFGHALHDRQGQVAVRRIQGMLALAKKFGVAALDKACAVALEMRVYEYRFVKHYLEHHPPAPLTLQQVDPLIRNLLEYRDVIQQKIKEPLSHEPD
ncbi:MAG: IS21 family transposase [Acidobacteria bacterium]|nr:IS21 family transposase [Acidobacteriota bacterium]